MNTMQVLAPYRYEGTWVFDDESKGLEKEPFVLGIPQIIDSFVPQEVEKIRLYFSNDEFPKYQGKLIWIAKESGGNWYKDENGREGWLCPALYHYFDLAPKTVFFSVEPIVP